MDPVRPPSVAYTPTAVSAIASVTTGESPKIAAPILMAASDTVPMMITLKKSPR